jgi:hypothetical protein
MKRIKLVVAVGALMVGMLVVMQGPAMAQDLDEDDFFFDFGDFNDNDGFFCDDFDFDGFCDFNDFDGFDFGDNVALDVDQETEETGDVTLDTSIVSTGDNSNQTAAPLEFGNTGNFQNAQGFVQVDSSADDIEFEGGSFEFSPTQGVDSNQGVSQSAGSSSRK